MRLAYYRVLSDVTSINNMAAFLKIEKKKCFKVEILCSKEEKGIAEGITN